MKEMSREGENCIENKADAVADERKIFLLSSTCTLLLKSIIPD